MSRAQVFAGTAQLLVFCCFSHAATDSQAINKAVQKNELANSLILAGKPEQAIPLYRELFTAFPQQLSFGTNLVLALYNAHHYTETVTTCKLLLKRDPNLIPALVYLGASELKLGAPEAAEISLRRALTQIPNDVSARVMLADVLLATKRPQEAASQYEFANQSLPDNPRVVFGLARSYRASVDTALSNIEGIAPNSAVALALRAELDMEHDRFSPAFAALKQVSELQPILRGAHELIAQIYQRTGHPDWAAKERAKSVEGLCDANDPTPECEFAAGHWQQLAAAQTAASPTAFYWQAKAFFALSQRAFEHLQNLPPSPESHQAAALEHEKHSRYPEAAASWKNAQQLDPSDPQFELNLALALCHGNDCVTALPLLKNQLVRQPDSAELNYFCGLALTSRRMPSEALPYLERSVRQNPKLLFAQAALGEAYLEANQPASAIEHLKASLADDPDGSRHYQLARAFRAAGLQPQASATLSEYREILRHRHADDLSQSGSITPP